MGLIPEDGARGVVVGGGGTVGSAAAFRIASLGLVSEVVLLDAREHMARSHAMDLEQAAAALGGAAVRPGSWDDLEGADVVVLSAGMPERNVASRDEYLAGNLGIVREAAARIAAARPAPGRPAAAVIVATNPVDVFTYALSRLLGGDDRRVLGYSWNDTLRMRWAVARVLDEPVSDVGCLVIGEHGELQVPLFDRVTVRGRPVRLSAGQEREAAASVRGWFASYQSLDSGRTSGWTSAVGLAEVVTALLHEGGAPVPASAVLHGEYGEEGVSLGVPVLLGRGGVREVVELPLTAAQAEAFRAAARKVRAALAAIL